MEAHINELKEFYRRREEKPEYYTYNDQGDFIQKNKENVVVKSIRIPSYRKPIESEITKNYDERQLRISTAEALLDRERKILYDIIGSATSTKTDILRQNTIVGNSETSVFLEKYPLRERFTLNSIERRNIFFDEPYEKRKVPYPIVSVKFLPLSLQTMYVREIPEGGDLPVHVIPSVSSSTTITNENEYLNLSWAVNISYNRTNYVSAYQALMGELAKSYQDRDSFEKILQSGTSMSFSFERGTRNQIEWEQRMKDLLLPIQRAKYKQYPILAKKLIQSGNTTIQVIEPRLPFLRESIQSSLEQVRKELLSEPSDRNVKQLKISIGKRKGL